MLDPPLSPAARRPSLLRVAVLLSVVNFLYWCGMSSTWATFSELLLRRACADHGLLLQSQCTAHPPGTSGNGTGAHAHANATHAALYAAAQRESSDRASVFGLAAGLASLFTVPVVGVLGDAFGRRLGLLVPAAGGLLYGLAVLLVPPASQNTWLLALYALSNCSGGMYGILLTVFASLADATQGSSGPERTRIFGIVESSLWVGMLAGPLTGGALAGAVGLQTSFAFCSIMMALALGVSLLAVPETLEPARRRPWRGSWSRANPFAAIMMLATNRSALGFSAALFFALNAGSGSIAMLPFFLAKALNFSPFDVGLLQSVFFGSCALGLAFVLPLLLRWTHKRALPMKYIVAGSMLCLVAVWSAFAFVRHAWQAYLVMALAFSANIFLPVIRVIVADTFGKSRYESCLCLSDTSRTPLCSSPPSPYTKKLPRTPILFIPCSLFPHLPLLLSRSLTHSTPFPDPPSPALLISLSRSLSPALSLPLFLS